MAPGTVPLRKPKGTSQKACLENSDGVGRGGKGPHPHTFSFTKKTARFTRGRFRSYEGPKMGLRRAISWQNTHPKHLWRLFFRNNLARQKITSKNKNNLARLF